MPKCLKCKKQLSYYDKKSNQVIGGGNVEITFRFGSRYDQGIEFTDAKPYQSYICDNCFEELDVC